MGCSTSSTEGANQSASSSPLPVSARGNLSIREIEIVKDSWAILAENRSDTGVAIFTRAFEMDKEIKSLFYRFSVNADATEKSESIEIDNEKFKLHADMVMQVFGECIEGLDNENTFDEHVETLRHVGQAHKKFNVHSSMIQTFWPAMKPLLQSQLRDIYTEEVDEAWDHVCNFILAKLTEGLERKEELPPEEDETAEVSEVQEAEVVTPGE